MFTGIISHCVPVSAIEPREFGVRLRVKVGPELVAGLEEGASVAVDGVCLTVVETANDEVAFDLMGETLRLTTFRAREAGDRVNVERSATFQDEIGGHVLSGHVSTTAAITDVHHEGDDYVVTFRLQAPWMKYVFPKGFIAIDGISLTIVDVDREVGTFTVHLIPETRQRTTLGEKQAGDAVNIEIDNRTQVTVDTIERILPEYLKRT